MGLTVTYSSAAPYIREAIIRATYSKINESTQRERARKEGTMYGLVSALKILLASPEGENSEVGYPEWHGTGETAILTELERYLGGAHEMQALGFIKEIIEEA